MWLLAGDAERAPRLGPVGSAAASATSAVCSASASASSSSARCEPSDTVLLGLEGEGFVGGEPGADVLAVGDRDLPKVGLDCERDAEPQRDRLCRRNRLPLPHEQQAFAHGRV
jgi:hypothetical protein